MDFCALKAGEVTASLLLVLDDCTRRVVAWRLMTNRSTRAVLEVLQDAFRREGKPVLVKADNGPEFRQTFRAGLAACGVAVLNSPFYYAPFNGKLERAYRALRRFLKFRPPAGELGALKQQIARWVWEHNALVVSESLGCQTPLRAMTRPELVLTAVPGQESVTPEQRAEGVVVRFTNRRGGKARLLMTLQAA